MERMSKRMAAGAGWAAVLLLAACVTPKSQVTMMQAPEVEAASKYTAVSVARFSGRGGDEMAQALEAALMNARIQDKAVYRAVRRLPDARAGNSDVRSLAVSARSQGSDALLTGEVVHMSVLDTPYQESEYVCDSYDRKKKYKCVSGRNVQVNCIKRSAALQVAIDLIDARTGQSVYQAYLPESSEVSACKGAELKAGSVLLGELSAAVIGRIKRAIVPHEQVVNIALMNDADGLVAAGSRERFAGAVKFAESGRMDRACETFGELHELDKRSVALNYNLGICEEAAAAYWRADELYRLADKLSQEPNKLVNEALKRNGEAMKKAGSLARNRSDLVSASKIEAGASPVVKTAPVQQVIVQGGIGNVTADALLWDKRVALVIGNGKYKRGELLNPVNDAAAIANELRKANFKVIKVENATLAKMNQAVEEFGRIIPKDGVALVFYAGHGMQVKGENYLIPVDADLKTENDAPFKTLNLGQILGKLEDAKSRVNLVVLDACRDNPFARSWRSGKGGLATIDAPAGTVIAFATAPGKVASDGIGANGLYTTHLLKALRLENLKLEDVLKLTRKGVAADSGNEQIPWDSSSLTGDFFFRVSQVVGKDGKVGALELRQSASEAEAEATNRNEAATSLGGFFKSVGDFLQGSN